MATPFSIGVQIFVYNYGNQEIWRSNMAERLYSKNESINRIERALRGVDIPNDAPGTLSGDLLSENEAMSNIAELMIGSLAGSAGVVPFGLHTRPAAYSDSKQFYVIPDHTNASDSNSGENPAYPLATIAQAWANCRAYHGDVIWVTSNDSWQYGAGTEGGIVESLVIPADKPGVAMIGVSRGSEGVYWQPTGSAGWCIWNKALDVTIDGFCFWGDASSTCKGIYLDWGAPSAFGENTIISNNTFTDECDTGIQMEYTWYVDIFNNRLQQCNEYGIVASVSGSGVQYLRIYDNWFNDCVGPAMLLGACENGLIRSNHIYNTAAQATGTSTGLGLVLVSGSAYNLVIDNNFSCILAEMADFCTGAPTDAWINNHCTDGLVVSTPA
jgi:hypothetical protein